MKKLLILSSFLVLFSFCAKEEQSLVNNLEQFDIQFQKIENWSNNVKTFSNGSLDNPNYYQGAINTVNNEDFTNFFMKFFREKTGENNLPSALVFFVNKPIDELQTLTSNNVVGITSYMASGNKLSHNLYLSDTNLFKEIVEFSFEVRSLTTNQIQYSLLKKVKTNFKEANSYILILNKSNGTLVGESDQFQIRTAVLESKRQTNDGASQREVPWVDVVASCASPCTDSKGNCEVYEQGLNQCVSAGCLVSDIETQLLNNNTFEPSYIEETFEESTFYSFRDNFLIQTNIGNKYINYYYALSAFLYQNVNLSIAANTATLLPQINEAIEKLQFPEINGDQILINEELKTDILQILAEYKSISENDDYNSVLDDIENDVNEFSNKTVDQVLTEIN